MIISWCYLPVLNQECGARSQKGEGLSRACNGSLSADDYLPGLDQAI